MKAHYTTGLPANRPRPFSLRPNPALSFSKTTRRFLRIATKCWSAFWSEANERSDRQAKGGPLGGDRVPSGGHSRRNAWLRPGESDAWGFGCDGAYQRCGTPGAEGRSADEGTRALAGSANEAGQDTGGHAGEVQGDS